MTVSSSIDPARPLEEQLAQASPDLLRDLLRSVLNTLLSAQVDAVCGAEYGTISPERVNRRNGYRAWEFDTRAGSIELAIPRSCVRAATSRTGCSSGTSGLSGCSLR